MTADALGRGVQYGSPEHSRLIADQIKRRRPFERAFGQEVARALKSIYDHAAATLALWVESQPRPVDPTKIWIPASQKNNNNQFVDLFVNDWDNGNLARAFYPRYWDVLTAFAKQNLKGLGLGLSFDIYNPHVIDWTSERSWRFADDLTAGEVDALSRIVGQAVMNAEQGGATLELIEFVIGRKFSERYQKRTRPYEIERIARTEMHRGSEMGQQIAATQAVAAIKEAGLPFVLKKAWLAAIDGRERLSHRAAHLRYQNDPIEIEGNFLVAGFPCEAPGMTGVKREDINCRCTAIYAAIPLTQPAEPKPAQTADEKRQAKERAAEKKARKEKQKEIDDRITELERFMSDPDFKSTETLQEEESRMMREWMRAKPGEPLFQLSYDDMASMIEEKQRKRRNRTVIVRDQIARMGPNTARRGKHFSFATEPKRILNETIEDAMTLDYQDFVGKDGPVDFASTFLESFSSDMFTTDDGQPFDIPTIVGRSGRAFYQPRYIQDKKPKGGFMELYYKRSNTGTAIHELMHAVEDRSSATLARSLAFLDKRTKGEQLVKMRDLFPDRNYKDDEVVWVDRFMSPYMGKDYDRYATEILSMGVQNIYEQPVEFFEHDPEYFRYVMRTVWGYPWD